MYEKLAIVKAGDALTQITHLTLIEVALNKKMSCKYSMNVSCNDQQMEIAQPIYFH